MFGPCEGIASSVGPAVIVLSVLTTFQISLCAVGFVKRREGDPSNAMQVGATSFASDVSVQALPSGSDAGES